MSSFHIPLTLLDPDGGWVNAPVHVHDLHGRPVLLHFWAMKCATCQGDLPQLQAWMREFVPDGLQVVGVHVPLSEDEGIDTNAIEAAALQAGLRHPIAADDGSLARAYGVDALPAYLVFDAEGWLRERVVGEGASRLVRPLLERLTGHAGRQSQPSVP